MERENLLKELREQYPIEEEIDFNDFNIEERLQSQLRLEMKYWDLLSAEKFHLSELESKMVDIRFKVYDHFRFEYERTLTKTEIELFYLPGHADIKEIQKRIDIQQVKVDYFKLCYNAVKQLQWNIKTYLKNREN